MEKVNCLLTVETITVDDNESGESGEDENIPVTSIVLDYSSLSLNIGESMQLAASVFPSNATNNAITWETSNSGIAMVDNGYVTAVASGDVVITARSVENTSIYATCVVNVATEESGGGSGETSGKIMFTELTPVKGEYMIKGDGVTEYARSNCCYYQLPYSDGMFVSTVGNTSFAGTNNQSNYPAIMVVASDGQVTKPDVTGETIEGAITHFSTTLSSFENVEKVFVNLHNAWIPSSDTYNPNTINTKYIEYCYYIPGGAL